MSRPMGVTRKCAVCHAESRQTVLASTNRFGAPDLALRPPEMMRSTMCWWVEECPQCGYAAANLEDLTPVSAVWLQAEDYRTCEGKNFLSPLAARFYKQYMILRQSEDGEETFAALLHAAWACDDAGDEENASACRRLALEPLEKLIAENGDNELLKVQRADILRRAGLFATLIAEYEPTAYSEEVHRKIVAFQIEKAKAKDSACYTLGDVKM